MPDTGHTLTIQVPRILLCGTRRGVGVSTIAFGTIVSFAREQLGVATATFGSNLVESTHYRRLSNRLSYSLDPALLAPEVLYSGLKRLSDGAELLLLEAQGGLFDHLPVESGFGTVADFAISTQTPVVLVIDVEGYGESIAAVIEGFLRHRPLTPIGGFILNRTSGREQTERLRRVLEGSERPGIQGIPFLGSIRKGDPHQMGATIASYRAHNPSALTRNRVIGTGNLIRDGLDLALLRSIAASAPSISLNGQEFPFRQKQIRIAVADDQAFHLTVQDNLDLLRRAGAELVPFSPIADPTLPKNIQGIYIPGGYPHLYAQDLHSNISLRRSIREYIEGGGSVYAEAGGVAFLSRSMTTFHGSAFDMVGIFPAHALAAMADDIQPELPREVLFSQGNQAFDSRIEKISGLRDTRWTYRMDSEVSPVFERKSQVPSGTGDLVGVPEAFGPRGNVLLSRCYLHWGSAPGLADAFVRASLK